MKKITEKEYLDFISSSPISPPLEITRNILETVSQGLNPSSSFVFSKIGIIHLIMGSITLLFCPQFGIGFLSDMGIMHFFMPLGNVACSTLCGSLFLGFSTLTMGLILKPEEIRVVRKNKFIQIFFLCLISYLVFAIFGAPIIPGLLLAWLLGGFVMGILSLEAAWYLRSKVLT